MGNGKENKTQFERFHGILLENPDFVRYMRLGLESVFNKFTPEQRVSLVNRGCALEEDVMMFDRWLDEFAFGYQMELKRKGREPLDDIVFRSILAVQADYQLNPTDLTGFQKSV